MIKGIVNGFLAAMLLSILFLPFKTIVVMLLWNWLMPAIFGLPALTFFQVIGLEILFGIMFKTTITLEGGKD